MDQFKNIHSGKRCFILGNGPSLNDVDLSLLDDEITFGTNRIYLSGFTPTYYVCVNPLVLDQFSEEIEQLDTTKFLPGFPLDTSLREPMFSSPAGPIWEGHTVTYVCLQLAFYMGFSEVILLGVDHDYGEQRQPNLEVVATGPDQHHFHPDYFSGGTRWHTPDLEMSELAYSLAKAAYERAGRRIINCSAHTKLEVFEKRPLSYVLLEKPPRVSAIVSAYHAEKYLKGLFLDLLAQTEMHEIVVVCQKDSKEHGICFDWQTKFRNLQIVTTPDIPTVYKAWNLGVKAAHGKYLTNANTDDRHHPRAYEIMADVLDARPEIDLVYHDSYITWEPNQTLTEFIQANHGKTLKPGRFQDEPGIFAFGKYDRARMAGGCFMGPQPMWRANLHQRYGMFLDNYKSAGDYEFWLRIAGDHNMFHIPAPLGLYHASLNGVELSNPELSAREANDAKIVHQAPEDYLTPIDDGTLQVNIDGRWSYWNVKDLVALLAKAGA